jgi:cathepsin D
VASGLGRELMQSSQGFWQVNIQKIQGNGQTKLGNIAAIIDTGANLIMGDWWEVYKLHSTLGGKAVGRGYYSCEFSSNSNSMFRFHRTSYSSV